MATATTDPFDRLLRSHRRLEERLRDLPLAAQDLDGPRRDEALAYVLETVAWMERAVKRHEDDEEKSLFPRLAGRAEVEALIARLSEEHRTHERLQEELRLAAPDDPDRARVLVRELQAAYATHIKEEETLLFPAARALLPPEVLAQIGAEMEARRDGDGGRRRPGARND
jgi:hemerythrin-like domain-containing protein